MAIDPYTAMMAAGLGLSFLKMNQEQQNEKEDIRIQAARERMAPLTGRAPRGSVRRSDPYGTLMQGLAAAGMAAQAKAQVDAAKIEAGVGDEFTADQFDYDQNTPSDFMGTSRMQGAGPAGSYMDELQRPNMALTNPPAGGGGNMYDEGANPQLPGVRDPQQVVDAQPTVTRSPGAVGGGDFTSPNSVTNQLGLDTNQKGDPYERDEKMQLISKDDVAGKKVYQNKLTGEKVEYKYQPIPEPSPTPVIAH